MKDYENYIIWLDYLNKNLSRKKGRRIRREKAVYDPSISELIDAMSELGFSIENESINDKARYPRRSFVRSGYVMISKGNLKKSLVLDSIAKIINEHRNKVKNR